MRFFGDDYMKNEIAKKDYFNRYEFMQALSIERTDPYEALNRYQVYLEKYPKDYAAYTYYATLLTTLRKYNEANIILNKVNELVKEDIRFSNNKALFNKYMADYNFSKIKLLLYWKKYQELYTQYLEPIGDANIANNLDLDVLLQKQNIKNIGLIGIKLTCWKKLGMLNIINREKYRYLLKQIIEYNENDFLTHIEKHLMSYNDLDDRFNESIFVNGFNVNEILAEIKKYIPSEKGLCTGTLENIYVFRYDECGRVNNKLVDYFQVVALHDTCELITMYPIDYGEFLPYVDLNYMNKLDTPKVKRRSQIDKFNQRFGVK